MRLTIVGCAGSYPNPAGPASCYLVEHDGFRMVLDLGSGALGPLQRYVDPAELDAVLLSHLHADHFLDVCGLYVARRYRPEGVPPLLPLYGPGGVASRVAAAYGMGPSEPMADVFDIHEYPAGDFTVGPFQVSHVRVRHPIECHALRVSVAAAGGAAGVTKSLVFSGDTGPCDELAELATGADVALFEASFREGDDNPRDLHMTAREAAEAARRAGVGRLILTHQVAWHDNSRALEEAAVFGGDVVAAEPGMVVEF